MSNAIVNYLPDMDAMTTKEVIAMMPRMLTVSADGLFWVARAWVRVEREGYDMTSLRRIMPRSLPMIATGRLAAEAVVAFAERPSVLRSLEGLPLPKQRELAAGALLEVIDPTDPKTVQSLPLVSLPHEMLRLVFFAGEVRPPAAQRLALRQSRQAKPAPPVRRYRPHHYDAAAGTITVGTMTVRLADLLTEIAASASPDGALDVAADYVTVKVRLTKAEAARLVETCQRVELPEWELVRKAMRAFGLI